MNVIGGFQNIINEHQNYFFVIDDTSICKCHVIKFIVSPVWIEVTCNSKNRLL